MKFQNPHILSPADLIRSWREAETQGKFMGEWARDNRYPIYTTIPLLCEYLEKEKSQQKATAFDVIADIPGRLERVWPSFMVVSDVQIPTTDWELARMVSYAAERRLKKPRRMIIAGDLLNYDAWSTYPQCLTPVAWQDEKEAARATLYLWLETFDEIIWLFGNHERRKLYAAQGIENETDILAMLRVPEKKIRVSLLDRCTVHTQSRAGDWVVCHGGDYAQGLLVKPDAYAQKYQSNVIAGHAHRQGMGMDRYNRYMIVQIGGLFDQSKMAYTEITTTSKPEMAQGFALIDEGYPELFSPIMTNWEKV